MKNLSIFLPTRNRPYLLFKTIKSFLKLNLSDSQIVIIDNDTKINEQINNIEYSIKNSINFFRKNQNVKFHIANKILDWEEQFNIYLNLSNNYKYFNMISDDDFFIMNEGIKEKISFLNNNENYSFALSSAFMFELSKKKFWKRKFINPNLSLNGDEFLDLFVSNEALQHTTITGLFRIKNMIDSKCFKVLPIIKKNNLQAGFGLDSRIYFRNACYGKVKIFGNYITRGIRFHEGGMTYNQPIESSYCYYWSIIDSFKYLDKKGIILKNKNLYLQQWIQNLLTCNLISNFLINKEKNYMVIENLINKNHINYIIGEIEKFNIIKNSYINRYLSLNKFLKYFPNYIFKKRDTHFIPKSKFEIILNFKIIYNIFSIAIKLKKNGFINRTISLVTRIKNEKFS